MKVPLLFALSALFFTSCAQVTQPQPAPQNWKQQIINRGFSELKDPDSAQYRWASDPYLKESGLGMTYHADYFLNAKNAFGGYTGYKERRAMFVNGTLKYIYNREENPLFF